MHAIVMCAHTFLNVCVHAACCVLELLLACHVPRYHTPLHDDYKIDIQGYVFPLITMSL